MIRMPDALESSIQKATDLGALGIIVPTVDDALEARDAARFSRYPPFGRRSAGGGAYRDLWNQPGLNYRATINDNMLVTVMIETLEGVAMANEIAATHGVDAVIIGNNDLSNFSGWSQTIRVTRTPSSRSTTPRSSTASLRQRRRTVPDRLHRQRRYADGPDGPACDGWRPAGRGGRGRGTGPEEEPVIGLTPGSAPKPAPAAAGGRGCRRPLVMLAVDKRRPQRRSNAEPRCAVLHVRFHAPSA